MLTAEQEYDIAADYLIDALDGFKKELPCYDSKKCLKKMLQVLSARNQDVCSR